MDCTNHAKTELDNWGHITVNWRFFYFRVNADEAASFDSLEEAEQWVYEQRVTGVLICSQYDAGRELALRMTVRWYNQGKHVGA